MIRTVRKQSSFWSFLTSSKMLMSLELLFFSYPFCPFLHLPSLQTLLPFPVFSHSLKKSLSSCSFHPLHASHDQSVPPVPIFSLLSYLSCSCPFPSRQLRLESKIIESSIPQNLLVAFLLFSVIVSGNNLMRCEIQD